MDYNLYVDAWNKKMSNRSSHIVINETVMNQIYKEFVCDKTELKNKIIIDFGCGGGFLGKFICDKYNPAQYIGLDISERSVRAAVENLKNFKNARIYKIAPMDIGLNSHGADALISLSVIQHFPDNEYYEYFFEAINNSGIGKLVLQIRQAEKLIFNCDGYKTINGIIFSCSTNSADVEGRLTNYNLSFASVVGGVAKYQYLYFNKR